MYNHSFSVQGVSLTPEIVGRIRDIVVEFFDALDQAGSEGEESAVVSADSSGNDPSMSPMDDLSTPPIGDVDDVTRGSVTDDLTSLTIGFEDGRNYTYSNSWEIGPNLEKIRGAYGKNLELRLFAASGTCSFSMSEHGGYFHGTLSGPDRTPEELVPALQEYLRSMVPEEELEKQKAEMKVFIAHGGNDHWTAVRDFIVSEGYAVDAFEEEDRVGRVTFEQVSHMVRTATVAVIIMNKTDEMADGTWRARQNVVHELGLSQALLGAPNVLILREEGVEMPSNLDGLTYIPYTSGSIYSTKAKVIAALKNRELDSAAYSRHGYGGR